MPVSTQSWDVTGTQVVLARQVRGVLAVLLVSVCPPSVNLWTWCQSLSTSTMSNKGREDKFIFSLHVSQNVDSGFVVSLLENRDVQNEKVR